MLDSIGFSATTTTRWPRWKSWGPGNLVGLRSLSTPIQALALDSHTEDSVCVSSPSHTPGAAPTLPPLRHPGSRRSAPLLSGGWHLRLTSDGTCAIIIYGTRSGICLGTWICKTVGTWLWHLACRISSIYNLHMAHSDIHV